MLVTGFCGNALVVLGVFLLNVRTDFIDEPLNVRGTQVLFKIIHQHAEKMGGHVPKMRVIQTDSHTCLVAFGKSSLLRRMLQGNRRVRPILKTEVPKDILINHSLYCLVHPLLDVAIKFILINNSIGGEPIRARKTAWDLVRSTAQDVGLDHT